MDLVQRIRSRPHDAPMPTEHLLDETADAMEKMLAALKLFASFASFDPPEGVTREVWFNAVMEARRLTVGRAGAPA